MRSLEAVLSVSTAPVHQLFELARIDTDANEEYTLDPSGLIQVILVTPGYERLAERIQSYFALDAKMLRARRQAAFGRFTSRPRLPQFTEASHRLFEILLRPPQHQPDGRLGISSRKLAYSCFLSGSKPLDLSLRDAGLRGLRLEVF